jgi:hypothetical protein
MSRFLSIIAYPALDTWMVEFKALIVEARLEIKPPDTERRLFEQVHVIYNVVQRYVVEPDLDNTFLESLTCTPGCGLSDTILPPRLERFVMFSISTAVRASRLLPSCWTRFAFPRYSSLSTRISARSFFLLRIRALPRKPE